MVEVQRRNEMGSNQGIKESSLNTRQILTQHESDIDRVNSSGHKSKLISLYITGPVDEQSEENDADFSYKEISELSDATEDV